MKPFKNVGAGRDHQGPKPSTQADAPRAETFDKVKHGAAGELPDVAQEGAAPPVGDNIPWPAAEPEKDNSGHKPFRVR